MKSREKEIIKASAIGITMNVFLVIFKALVGFLSNSIAIILDAVNNLSDTISAIVTIVGTKLSAKAPDREHPFGHGRIEYFSAIIISSIVLWAGIGAFRESVIRIINPIKATYSIYTLAVIIVAIIVKFFFGKYAKKVGKSINSQSLVATGADAYMDSVLSFSTLICGLMSMFLDYSIEGYVGVIISIMILKSAISILQETLDVMIGSRPDSTLTKTLKDKINSYNGVQGTNDLMLHSYGPNRLYGSAHITVNDSMTARDIHGLTRMISEDILDEFGIVITLGVYALNENEEINSIKQDIEKIVKEYKEIIEIHGFYINEQIKRVSFDLIFDFSCKDPERIKAEIKKKIKEKYPEYRSHVLIDSDVSD